MNLGIRSPMRHNPFAIGAPTEAEAFNVSNVTSSFTITGDTVRPGNRAFLAVGFNAADKLVTSVTDDAGNVWTVDKTANLNGAAVSFCSTPNNAGIAAANIITVNVSPSTSAVAYYWLIRVPGVIATLNQSATGTGTGTSALTSATGTLSSANQIVFGFFATNGSATWTKDASYSIGALTPSQTGRTAIEYKIVAATTAVTAAGTWGTSRDWAGIVVTYPGQTP